MLRKRFSYNDIILVPINLAHKGVQPHVLGPLLPSSAPMLTEAWISSWKMNHGRIYFQVATLCNFTDNTAALNEKSHIKMQLD